VGIVTRILDSVQAYPSFQGNPVHSRALDIDGRNSSDDPSWMMRPLLARAFPYPSPSGAALAPSARVVGIESQTDDQFSVLQRCA